MMKYSLFKLHFQTAVHFGLSDSALSLYTSAERFCADTLFSALCHTALSLYGPQGVEELCAQAQQGELLLSDSMPWQGENWYLPKPVITSDKKQEVPANLRKAMKKLQWISPKDFELFAQSLKSGTPFDAASYPQNFDKHVAVTKVSKPGLKVSLYQVGITCFYPDTGLYFIAACQNENQERNLRTLVDALGISGIGGKVSSGYGRFSVKEQLALNEPQNQQTQWLLEALLNQSAPHQLLLTTSLPAEDELESVLPHTSYQLVRRGGFIRPDSSVQYERKKKTQYFFSSGAVTNCRYHGGLYEVGDSAEHPVYRYSRPLFLGVSL